MRLGCPLPGDLDQALALGRQLGLGAVYLQEQWCPDEATARTVGEAIRAQGFVVAEVGAWCNPLDPDPTARAAAHARCVRLLGIAEAAGARCCVNIVGSRSASWDGPAAADLAADALACAVASVRAIVDAVRPTRTVYTLETMPWMIPDSPESYRELLEAIDRPSVAVHYDPVNLVNTPRRYFQQELVIDRFIDLLGPRIRSVHCKDVRLLPGLPVHLAECRPGTGALDHARLLTRLARLDPDLPVMLEHLPSHAEYLAGVAHLQQVAAGAGLAFTPAVPPARARSAVSG